MPEILKLVCLVLGIWFTYANLGSTFNRGSVSTARCAAMALSDGVFIYLQWLR